MEDRAIAILQLNKAYTALKAAAEHLELSGANTTLTGTADTLQETTGHLLDYAKKELSRPKIIIDPESLPDPEDTETAEAMVNIIDWYFEKKETEIQYRDDRHRELFLNWCKQLHIIKDPEYRAALYLLALDEVTREHATEIFDFDNLCIIPKSINSKWQTGTSANTTRLLFNLYNYSIHEDTTNEGEQIAGSGYNYTPAVIFACSYAPYYTQALKLRYPERFTE